ncbi:MAG: hypothetical protein IJ833_10140 [Lachnospiraceae bacterium]|nr:hypothetical protein [Lachnospiraceae bacterium]
MENKEQTTTFDYSYSAKKQQEIEQLKEKYMPYSHQDSVLEQMKELDRQAEKAASAQPILLGAIGCVLLGLGMCGTMAFTSKILFVLGIIVGVLGIGLVGVAYPLYLKKIKEERERIAPQILELAERTEKE